MNIGAVMNNLFGSKSGGTNAAPENPSAQPKTQRESQERDAGGGNTGVRGRTPSGDSTVLEGGGNDAGNDPSGDKAAVNPLDKFSKIWDAPLGADGKPKQTGRQKVIPDIDPAKITEFASRQDFKKFVKPETLAAIAKGGDEGTAAFAQAMQDIGSSTFASAMTASTQMMSAALERQQGQFEASLPELFKKFSLKENLGNKNPVLKHAAAKPIVDALQSVLARSYPESSSAELQTMAEDYLTTFATSLSGKGTTEDADAGVKGGKKEQDWSKFLEE